MDFRNEVEKNTMRSIKVLTKSLRNLSQFVAGKLADVPAFRPIRTLTLRNAKQCLEDRSLFLRTLPLVDSAN